MRIISKFKDYYDSGAMYGIDTERIYTREQKKMELACTVNVDAYEIIGFCGEIFPITNFSQQDVSTTSGNTDKWERHPKDFILYEEEAREYSFQAKDNKHTLSPTQYIKVRRKDQKFWKWGFGSTTIDREFERIKNSKELKELFLKYKTPVFHLKQTRDSATGYKLTLNPTLKNYAFYKIYDTTQAFQRLEMFISNILVGEKPVIVPTGNSEVVGRSKGFDEYSFRNINTKKKPKKF